MTKKPRTALLRVEWPAGKKLIIKEIVALDQDGRPVSLKVLSVTPEEPGRVGQDPVAWQQGFDAVRRGLARGANPYPPGDSALAWAAGYIDGKAKLLRSVEE